MHAASILSPASALPGAAADTGGGAAVDGDLFAGLMAALMAPSPQPQAIAATAPAQDQAGAKTAAVDGQPGVAAALRGAVGPTPPTQRSGLAAAPTFGLAAERGKADLTPDLGGERPGPLIRQALDGPPGKPSVTPEIAAQSGAPARQDVSTIAPATLPTPQLAAEHQSGPGRAPAAKLEAKDTPAAQTLPLPAALASAGAELKSLQGRSEGAASLAGAAAATLIAAQTQPPPAVALQPAPMKVAPAAKADKASEPTADAKAPAATGKPVAASTLDHARQAEPVAATASAEDRAPDPDLDRREPPPASPQPTAEARADTSAAPAAAIGHAAVVRGSPHTVAQLSAEIARKLDAQTTRFQVELDPAGLGRVDVKVEINASGALTASLNFDSTQSAEALRARSGELQASLERAGFDLGGGLSFTSGGMSQGQQAPDNRHGAQPARQTLGLALDEAAGPAAPQLRTAAADGRVDIRI